MLVPGKRRGAIGWAGVHRARGLWFDADLRTVTGKDLSRGLRRIAPSHAPSGAACMWQAAVGRCSRKPLIPFFWVQDNDHFLPEAYQWYCWGRCRNWIVSWQCKRRFWNSLQFRNSNRKKGQFTVLEVKLTHDKVQLKCCVIICRNEHENSESLCEFCPKQIVALYFSERSRQWRIASNSPWNATQPVTAFEEYWCWHCSIDWDHARRTANCRSKQWE